MTVPGAIIRYRSVFISDIHLGTRGSRADFLADFLRRTSAEHIYLVGDIIDGWRLRRGWYWDRHHDDVINLLLRHARAGAKITYVPGNHDELVRRYLHLGLEIAGVRFAEEAEHVTAAGERLLVIHGDQFDSVVRYAKLLAVLGDWAYTGALVLNRWFNIARARFGYPYWSLSAYLKRQVKEAVKAIDRFEVALAAEASARGFDGVVCGHIHHPEMRVVNGVRYINDGDWVESCTALVEHHDGRLELLDWAALNRLSFLAPRGETAQPGAMDAAPA
ncbi:MULTISPECIES: UDP-2,3-diacylglucosamine diphosphatase [Acidiphilium]|jgi:UDP-2,3-diacylglucosamine pyrophosphatase LpxH|uniref:Metallophosphoesterase n=1 Tax=Acidiphilium cryptum (strain JF-5) TaxID=349163 RepID=A5G2N3_ACICJ|nr:MULTISPECIES: UDP-2,3-diacylglucosamine diphosphatase [Acidiphilium]MBU6358131.1 UDP-2,3-diacylglucosamine diphosphatase [Rhodospirillales bacterium]ABQ32115.1 metallophosphoesterase [Acidiphilium cryptum JF-5]EGO96608.1 Metallophosphoesterase [Acidiphilium sp. PM]KDM66928.1 metallophosphoesterase [Acidiphilium sp. JA12-A1]MBS3022795.1 UDP-2,3-diacylglucosamine diphosphatase [Acidiphilium multivorum]